MASDDEPVKVFISYSHEGEKHAERVRRLSDRLRSDGIDCRIDQYETGPEEGWRVWMDRHIEWADYVLAVCTETYHRRARRDEVPGAGLGSTYEISQLLDLLYDAGMRNKRTIPVLFEGASDDDVPQPLRPYACYPLADDLGQGYEDLLRHLAGKPRVKPAALGSLPNLPTRPPAWTEASEPKVDVGRMPSTILSKLIGRTEELAMLDEAWADPATHVVTVVAVGGAGKTALVHHWMQRFEREGWKERGAAAAFAWSFYSQGGGDDRQASGDAFIDAALRFFGEHEPPKSARDRGLRLAELVRQRRTLLILDGLEPLQELPGSAREGRVKDPAVAALIRALAADNPGLLVLTSRQSVADLTSREGGSVQTHDMEQLSEAAGAALLRWLDVEGKEAELEAIAEEVHGHAFALTLLATFLRDAHDGDVRAWKDLRLLEVADLVGNEQASRMMTAYSDWFGDGPERQVLSILGLFDRPADAAAVAALREEPASRGLTDQLTGLSSTQWKLALKRLRRARLLLDDEASDGGTFDAHPLVREHFGRVLERDALDAYREGHLRLYRYYAAATDDLPDTLESMQPLYLAIGHGCRAGRRQEVYDEVYWRRIQRQSQFFSLKKLGAYGTNLTALAGFFVRPWDRPAAELRTPDRAWLLNEAGFCLRSLGRLAEAIESTKAGLALNLGTEDWKNSAINANNLSELALTHGEVDAAVDHAHQAVELADRSDFLLCRVLSHSTLGDALHAAGKLDDAQAAFRKAEALQEGSFFSKLHSLRGYKYCDLLLTRAAPLDGSALNWGSARYINDTARANCKKVHERGKLTLKWAKSYLGPLDIALDHISLGRASLGLELANSGNVDAAIVPLTAAVLGVREAGTEDHMPSGLLARANLHRFRDDTDSATADLTEAFDIAERGQMRLHLCDIHLEWGRLRLHADDRDGAREHLEKARALVEATGYRRRQREVDELTAALAS